MGSNLTSEVDLPEKLDAKTGSRRSRSVRINGLRGLRSMGGDVLHARILAPLSASQVKLSDHDQRHPVNQSRSAAVTFSFQLVLMHRIIQVLTSRHGFKQPFPIRNRCTGGQKGCIQNKDFPLLTLSECQNCCCLLRPH